MTQTLRRELRQKLSAVFVTFKHNGKIEGGFDGDENDFLDALADAALEVRGIAMADKPTARIDRTEAEQERLDEKKFDDLFPQSQDELDETKHRDEIAAHYESEMGYNPLQWWTDKKLMRLLKFLLTKTPAEITTFANWSKREYSPLSPTQARKNPDLVIECWPQACQTTEANFTKTPAASETELAKFLRGEQ